MFFEKIPFVVRLILPILWYGLICFLTELPVAGNYYTAKVFNDATAPVYTEIAKKKADPVYINPIADVLNTAFRVGSHLFVFGILAVLIYLLIQPSLLFNKKKYWITLLIIIILGTLDEVHQTFVPGRLGVPVDVLKDAIGAVLFVLLVTFWKSKMIKIENKGI